MRDLHAGEVEVTRYWSCIPYRVFVHGAWALMIDSRMVRSLVERRSLYAVSR